MSQQPLISHEAPIHGSQNLVVRPPDQLVGRDSDLTAIHLALRAGTAVLLHGPSGIGKTALAAHLAAGYAELPGGVLWFEVAGDSVGVLVNRVIRAYAHTVPTSDDSVSAVEQARALLLENRPLMVLDGDVDIDAAREFVKSVVEATPLLLISEQMVPGPWTPHAVEQLENEAAEAMLFHVAGASLESHVDQIGRLRARLGGHPMSLYVAGRVLAGTGKTPDELLAQMPQVPPGDLNQIMALLMAANRMLPAALQGLVLLSGIALAGGASVELLADVSGAPIDVMRNTMRNLAAFGFVNERLVHEQPYFAVHELVAQFAETVLQGKKQLDAMRERHLQGLLTYLRRDDSDSDVMRYDRLAVEMPTVLAAAKFAAAHDREAYIQSLIDLIEGAGDFVSARHYEAELGVLKQLLEPEPAIEAAPAPESMVPDDAPSTVPQDEAQEAIPAPERARVEAGASPPADEITPEQFDVGELESDAAESVIEEELSFDELDDELSATLEEVALEPLAEAETSDDEDGEDDSVESQPLAETVGMDTSAAIEQYSKAVDEFKADGNVEDELAAIEALASLNLDAENYDEVLAYVDRGMALAEETDNPEREAQLLVVLGDMQAMLGRYQGAEMAYKEAVAAFRFTESWRDIALTLDKLGTLYAEYGRQPDAATVWDQAIPIFEQIEDNTRLALLLDRLGTLHAQNFHWDQALKYFSQALELAKQSGNRQTMFEELWRLGRVLESSGATDGAQNFYRQALGLAFELDNDAQLGHTLLALGRILMNDTLQLNRVIQLLEAARDRLPENDEVQRLLKRATTRQQRLLKADITLLLAEDSVEDYAKATDNSQESLSDIDQLGL